MTSYSSVEAATHNDVILSLTEVFLCVVHLALFEMLFLPFSNYLLVPTFFPAIVTPFLGILFLSPTSFGSCSHLF
jgi:hypothetical protein